MVFADAKLATEATRLAFIYGLGIVLSVLIAIAFFTLVWKVLKTNNERELRLAGIIENHQNHQTEALVRLEQSLTENMRHIRETDKLQRDEHKEMISLLRFAQSKAG